MNLDVLEPRRVHGVCRQHARGQGALTYGDVAVPGRDPAGVVLVHTHTLPSVARERQRLRAGRDHDGRGALARPRLPPLVPVRVRTGTIGAPTWLEPQPDVIPGSWPGSSSTTSATGSFRYKRSRRGDARIDRIVEHVLRGWSADARIDDFEPIGYDERQYCAPGFDLPVARFRAAVRQYPEYHTSGDDLGLIGAPELQESVETLLEIIDVLDADVTYRNTSPYGEPRLGARGALPVDRWRRTGPDQAAFLWVLILSDGGLAVRRRGAVGAALRRPRARCGFPRRCRTAGGARSMPARNDRPHTVWRSSVPASRGSARRITSAIATR